MTVSSKYKNKDLGVSYLKPPYISCPSIARQNFLMMAIIARAYLAVEAAYAAWQPSPRYGY